ncbi:Cytochrome b5 heme-binding domain-containing protein [Caenorhabditis elegans]|uniref:Cytochrome b5 heme-binding domain-containing protein n=1 Tax=Caenorhabditis elegans TaxID=6239 RepID=O01816_CAEEL|nr:Cytochrome b5 heme-binding domain-containing protein [Caenorhabditis elegans]CCD68984.1 Cytochrome b5 heme-binding domain-containing protein [Caenorhabditis elegans]|eukprot:NP_491931.1 YTochrome B [Caenorhabditis elegans]
MSELRVISLDEVSKHNWEDADQSCWIVISGKVYDVTKFLNEHPGGEEVITQLAGKDATVGFLDVGHSKDAIEMANEYLIGQLPESDVPKVETAAAKPSKNEKSSSLLNDFTEIMTSPTWTNFLIPTTMGLVIYAVYKCMFN